MTCETSSEANSPHSFSRQFGLEYLLLDALWLCCWVGWCWKRGFRLALLRGLVCGLLVFYIDGVLWFNTPIHNDGSNPRCTQREWRFDAGHRSWERAFPHPYWQIGDPYVLMKWGCDFMMDISYGIVYFSWETLMFQHSVTSDAKRTASVLLFLGNFSLVPLSWVFEGAIGITAHGVRHMATEGQNVFRWYGSERKVLVMYAILAVFEALRSVSLRRTLECILHCFCVGCFQAFVMVFPLYVFGVRGKTSSMLHEIVFLINQGTPSSYVFLTLLRGGRYCLLDSVTPCWMRLVRPFYNRFLSMRSVEATVASFRPETERDRECVEDAVRQRRLHDPTVYCERHWAWETGMLYETHKLVLKYYAKHHESLKHKRFHVVVVTGMPRSGTTYLHERLLRENPSWKGLELHDMVYPLDSDSNNSKHRMKRELVAQKWLFYGWNKAFQTVHRYQHDALEEETVLLRAALCWDPSACQNRHIELGYKYIETVLRLKFNDGDTIVLKSPYHLLYPRQVSKLADRIVLLRRKESNRRRAERSWLKLQKICSPWTSVVSNERAHYEPWIEQRVAAQLAEFRKGYDILSSGEKSKTRCVVSETVFDDDESGAAADVVGSISNFCAARKCKHG